MAAGRVPGYVIHPTGPCYGRTRMSQRLLISILVAVLGACTSRPVPPTDAPSSPSAEVTPTVSPTAGDASPASARPSPTSTPATSSPSPAPSLGADGLEVLELEVTGCPGGVALDWSPATDARFHHYTALRSLEPDVATAYPPIAPAVDWGDSYATDRFVTSAVDATLIPSEAMFYYRVMAYDGRNRPVAASPVSRTRPTEVVDLGALVVEAGAGGATRLHWRLFGGLGRCFSAYNILIGPAGTTPSTTLTVMSIQSTTELETAGLHAGRAYAVGVEVVRTTTLGGFVVARTATATYTVP